MELIMYSVAFPHSEHLSSKTEKLGWHLVKGAKVCSPHSTVPGNIYLCQTIEYSPLRCKKPWLMHHLMPLNWVSITEPESDIGDMEVKSSAVHGCSGLLLEADISYS